MNDLPLPRTWVVMLAAAAGVGIGVGLVFVDYASWCPAERKITSWSPFLVWLGLIGAQTMFWTVAIVPLAFAFRRQLHAAERSTVTREVLPSAAVLVLIVIAMTITWQLIAELPEFMPRQHLKILALSSLALSAALLAAMTIWLIRGRLEPMARTGRYERAELDLYLDLRSQLEKLLAFLGGVIGLAVLASAALRQITLKRFPDTSYPPEVVLLYGFALSLLVALVYLPTYGTLRATGVRLRDSLAPPPDPTADDLEAKLERRRTLDDLLGLKLSATASFRGSVAILSPLLGSLTSLLPKLGG